LGWSHYRTLMRLPEAQRGFYEQVAAASRWSSRELDKQINSMLYERTALSRKPEQILEALLWRSSTRLLPAWMTCFAARCWRIPHRLPAE
jgi:predicted nuclease of restriction endonuclease-like (RecB) superfamily